jgi:hypothetical protein
MKHVLLTVLFACMIIPLKSQNTPSQSVLPESPLIIGRISLVSPKIVMEVAPNDKFTLTTGFWIRPSLYHKDSQGNDVYDPTISPSFTIEPRYYFNLEDRKQKGKRTEYYSGWYVGMPFNIEFPDFKFIWGGNIGFQCIMGKRWYWNISTGPGFSFSDSRIQFTGIGDLGLGIILN